MTAVEEEEEEDSLEAAKKKKKRAKKKKTKATDDRRDGSADASTEAPVEVATIDEGALDDGYSMMPHIAPLGPISEEDWVDVTEMCDLACGGMKLGEMVESPHFRLFDAMSAIEIMDPKMDTGFNNSADMTLDRAEEEGVIQQILNHHQLTAICDQLLMYYLLWLDGHTIVQTIFSCLYLQDPARHLQPIPLLGAFVDSLLVACRTARLAVLRAGVFDDEDFLPNLFGVDIEERCTFSVKPLEVADSLGKHRKALAKESNAADSGPARVSRRLEFIGEYMLALTDLHSQEGSSGSEKRRASAKRRLEACLKSIGQMRSEAQLDAAESEAALRCFDSSFNRKLLVPGPPRTVQPLQDRDAVLSMWASHLTELLLCMNVAQFSLARFLDCPFPKKGDMNVLPRSFAHLYLVREGHLRNLVLLSLEASLFPPEALQHCKKASDSFLAHCESMFSHVVKLASANNARRFRRLAHFFSDFNTLQREAWQFDEELKRTFAANLHYPRPCWVWVMEQCLIAMITKLFLGFDLDLYDEAEYHMIYWYVDYLYGLRIYNMIEVCVAKEQVAGGGSKKRPSGTRQQQDKSGARPRPRNPPSALLLLEATQATVRGLFRLLAFCQRHKLLQSPAEASAAMAQRFVLRFRSLEHFRLPHLPSFRDFEASSASAQALEESFIVLEAAKGSFSEASQSLERMSSTKDRDDVDERTSDMAKSIKRVVVANTLAVAELARMVEEGSTRKVVAAPTHHPHLVSVQVMAAPAHNPHLVSVQGVC